MKSFLFLVFIQNDHFVNIVCSFPCRYVKENIFAMVPAHLDIEWKFVSNDEDHADYSLHDERTMRKSMVSFTFT